MKHAIFLKSVAVISLGGLIAKAIGALYRFPLGALLGGYGMGLYSMAYPLFCVLLTFSSAGIPSAFSRIVAERTARGEPVPMRPALAMFAFLGAAGTAVMLIFAPIMAKLQGEPSLAPCYYALAPSVFFVALIAVFRGYFQGKNNMFPTAASEIAEQLVKSSFGLFLAMRFARDSAQAAFCALAAVTASELVALVCLALRYRGEPRRKLMSARPATGGSVLRSALPVMAASALLPLSQMTDSVLVVRLLQRRTARAVAQYGLFSGGASSLVSLPATVCYGLVAATVTSVSFRMAKGDVRGGKRRAVYALALTLALSLPCAAGLFVFSVPIARFLYPALGEEDVLLLARLVRLSSVSAATLAGVDTLSACLTGMGRAKRAAFSMLAAVIVKHALQFALIPALGVAGAAIAANVCYLVAFSLDLIYTVTARQKENRHDHGHRTRNGTRRSHGARTGGDAVGKDGAFEHRITARRRRPEGSGHRL